MRDAEPQLVADGHLDGAATEIRVVADAREAACEDDGAASRVMPGPATIGVGPALIVVARREAGVDHLAGKADGVPSDHGHSSVTGPLWRAGHAAAIGQLLLTQICASTRDADDVAGEHSPA